MISPKTDQKCCKECAAQIRGRADKKFCCSDCRISYHNRLNFKLNKHIRAINIILRRNRKILYLLSLEGRTRVFEHELISLNFNFNYVTTIEETSDNQVLMYCYEQAYKRLANGMVELMSNDVAMRDQGRNRTA